MSSRNLFRSISSSPTYIIWWNTFLKPMILKSLLSIMHIAFWITVLISIKTLINQPPPSSQEILDSKSQREESKELIKAPECHY